ncbi:hypothetical protein [Parendozoicomonas haliclonae]|uniref:Uncharacterized protein n=1 Tax=Parendozoicomonas haliclonae TaxID=1960125 RepID=A0A1X7AFF5_9GAMM|nr:hypothetical protein [Parendozoicomonas haliclonae]SMA36189.1 hypothetical protein EHSB41UT_00607 [Parendozoicomonas haliclonae]
MRERIDDAVKDFNRTLGIQGVGLPESGIMDFAFESGSRFFIKLQENGVLLYLLREIPDFSIDSSSLKALTLCHHQQSRKFDTQCALKDGNQLIFIVSLSSDAITGPDIEVVLQHLMKLQDMVVS